MYDAYTNIQQVQSDFRLWEADSVPSGGCLHDFMVIADTVRCNKLLLRM